VAPLDTLERLRNDVDEVVYLETPEPFGAVGYWYVDFAQVEDSEVVEVLEAFHTRTPAAARR
jgi:predicted phosphoribosyltransferase